MKRVFLIGYMGTGKTTLGKIISKQMNLTFIDLDIYIENRYHKTISKIFEEVGEEGFRKIERTSLEEVSEFENIIIATGGGTPCFFDNMEFMNNKGTTIYLMTNNKVLFERLRIASQNRPIIKGKTDDELSEFIKINVDKRHPFYSKSNLCFDANKLDNRSQINEAGKKLVELITKENR